MAIYEYLIIYSVYSTESITVQGTGGEPRQQQAGKVTYEVWRPNSAVAEQRPGDTRLSALFNEFGLEGWQLVASEVPDSVVVSGSHFGWPEARVPVRQRWIFMRETRS